MTIDRSEREVDRVLRVRAHLRLALARLGRRLRESTTAGASDGRRIDHRREVRFRLVDRGELTGEIVVDAAARLGAADSFGGGLGEARGLRELLALLLEELAGLLELAGLEELIRLEERLCRATSLEASCDERIELGSTK